MQDFRKLRVWRLAHWLAIDVYRRTSGLPTPERFGLQAQLRRSASSIPANIAEGCGRSGAAELRRYVYIASGSASELSYHLMLCRDLDYIDNADFQALSSQTSDVMRMLRGLADRLTNNEQRITNG